MIATTEKRETMGFVLKKQISSEGAGRNPGQEKTVLRHRGARRSLTKGRGVGDVGKHSEAT